MSPAQNNAKPLAAVCDRRSRGDLGSHSQSLQAEPFFDPVYFSVSREVEGGLTSFGKMVSWQT